MNKSRFPRAAYVRRLETVYDELSAWRSIYMASASYALDEPQELRYEDRARVLEDVQHKIMDAIRTLESLPRVS